jgi:hypothetical protein
LIRLDRPDVPAARLRFIGLTATLANVGDVADWLEVPESHRMVFGDEFRTVPLERHVEAYFDGPNEFLFNEFLPRRLPEVIKRYSQGNPTLVFCTSRAACQLAAQVVADAATRLSPVDRKENTLSLIRSANKGSHGPSGFLTAMGLARKPSGLLDEAGRDRLAGLASELSDPLLASLLPTGVAFHHGGLSLADREHLESLFRGGELPVLTATTTLALGVNLPAFLVVVLSTSAYRGSPHGYQELEIADVLQMLGRAGRPDFGSHGVGVVMTSHSRRQIYEDALFGPKKPVESSAFDHLTEFLNADIASCSFTNVQDLESWVKSTFLYLRARRNPSQYSRLTQLCSERAGESIASFVLRCIVKSCGSCLEQLVAAGFVQQEEEAVVPRSPCRVMAQHMLNFASAQEIACVSYTASVQELLRTACQLHEVMHDVALRRGEKTTLNNLNSGKLPGVRFRVPGRVQLPWEKVFILAQAHLSGTRLEDARLVQDTQHALTRLRRVVHSMVDMSCSEHVRNPATVNLILLQRSLETSSWTLVDTSLADAPPPVRPLQDLLSWVTDDTLTQWNREGIQTLQDLAGATLPPDVTSAPAEELQELLTCLFRITLEATVESGHLHLTVRLPHTRFMGSDKLREFYCVVCRNAPGGLCESRTVVLGEAILKRVVPLVLPLQGTVRERAPSRAQEPRGNPDKVFVHVLHKHLHGVDRYIVVDTATGVTRTGAFHPPAPARTRSAAAASSSSKRAPVMTMKEILNAASLTTTSTSTPAMTTTSMVRSPSAKSIPAVMAAAPSTTMVMASPHHHATIQALGVSPARATPPARAKTTPSSRATAAASRGLGVLERFARGASVRAIPATPQRRVPPSDFPTLHPRKTPALPPPTSGSQWDEFF